jgi:uncharacterized protein DUF6527
MLYTVRPEYVESFPKILDDGVLYISKKFRTSCHRCCCGCGTKIVTPIRPTEYQLTERGGLISLHPSIGNWNHPCQSHYVIRDNKVLWAEKMLQSDIKRGRARDDAEKDAYFGAAAEGRWSRLIRWFGRLFR